MFVAMARFFSAGEMQPGDCAVINHNTEGHDGTISTAEDTECNCNVRGLCVKEAREAFNVQVRVQPGGTSWPFNLRRLLTGPSKQCIQAYFHGASPTNAKAMYCRLWILKTKV